MRVGCAAAADGPHERSPDLCVATVPRKAGSMCGAPGHRGVLQRGATHFPGGYGSSVYPATGISGAPTDHRGCSASDFPHSHTLTHSHTSLSENISLGVLSEGLQRGWLAGAHIGLAETRPLFQAAQKMEHLEYLGLPNNAIGDSAATIFTELLCSHESLTALNLRGVNVLACLCLWDSSHRQCPVRAVLLRWCVRSLMTT